MNHIDFSGISDEAGQPIETQIRAHQTLGWKFVELRNVSHTQFTDITDEQFDDVCAKLEAAGLKVSCFASGIANWATKISDPREKSVETLKRVIPRMHRLGTKYIRVMSYPNDKWPEDQWRDESVSRMKELAALAEEAGIILLVENCDGWASTSAENYGRYFELVNSPAVKAVYDTGNPASHGQTNTWEWYQNAKPHIAYIHIKAHTTGEGGGHVWPDAGESYVVETLKDQFASGYSGFISIEPHMKAVVHEGRQITDEEAAFETYVEYGRRLEALVASLR